MSGLEAVTALLDRRPDARLAYVFGSVAAGRAHRGSDVDVAVLLASPPSPATLDLLAKELEAVAGHPIDLVNLATAPPLLAHEVVRSGHDYAEVDLSRVLAGVNRLDDFDAFVADVAAFLSS